MKLAAPLALADDQPCPCGRTQGQGPRAAVRSFGACCGPLILQGQAAEDAQALMRSRYTAFVLQHSDYLLRSWHASQRPASLELEHGVKWLGLEVRAHRVLDAGHEEVEFVARQKPASGAAVRLHERSRFVKEGAHWFYVDGDLL